MTDTGRARHRLARGGVQQAHAAGVVAAMDESTPAIDGHAGHVHHLLAVEAVTSSPDRADRINKAADPAWREVRAQQLARDRPASGFVRLPQRRRIADERRYYLLARP